MADHSDMSLPPGPPDGSAAGLRRAVPQDTACGVDADSVGDMPPGPPGGAMFGLGAPGDRDAHESATDDSAAMPAGPPGGAEFLGAIPAMPPGPPSAVSPPLGLPAALDALAAPSDASDLMLPSGSPGEGVGGSPLPPGTPQDVTRSGAGGPPGAGGGEASATREFGRKARDDSLAGHVDPPTSSGEWNCISTFYVERSVDDSGYEWINQYRLLGKGLGQGEFGKVVLAERIPGGRASDPAPPEPIGEEKPRYQRFAIKVISKRKLQAKKEYRRIDGRMQKVTMLDYVRREVELMRHLYHRHVALIYECIDDDEHEKMYLVLELMPGGICMDRVVGTWSFTYRDTGKPMPREMVPMHTMEVAKGLMYLHARGIAHRDIKPDNLLIDRYGRCVITDLGVSKQFDMDDQEGIVDDSAGTPTFRSPEAVSGGLYSAFTTDVWALGVTAFVFTYGVLPVKIDGSEYELYEAIRRHDLVWPDVDGHGEPVPAEHLDLLQRMLDPDPVSRIDLEGVLRHPFLAGAVAKVRAADEARLAAMRANEIVTTAISSAKQTACAASGEPAATDSERGEQ